MVSKSTYYVLAVKTVDGMRYLHGNDLTDNIYDTNWFNGVEYAKLTLKTTKGEVKNYAKAMEPYIKENQKELAHCMEYLATHQVEEHDKDTVTNMEGVLTRFRNRMKKADENLKSISKGIADKKAFEDKIEDLYVYALVASYDDYQLTTELKIDGVIY